MNTPAPIRPLSTFATCFNDVHDAVLLPDDDTLVVCAGTGCELHLVSLSAKSVRTVSGHEDLVNTLALADSGRLLLSGSDDGTIRLWDTETWATRLVLEGHRDFVCDVAAVGMLAVSGSEDGTVRVWDLTDGSCRAVFAGHEAGVDVVALNPDATTAVSASTDNHVMIWDLNTGTGRDLYRSDGGGVNSLGRNYSGKGHRERPSAMLFGVDSGTLYTAKSELIAWNLADGTEQARSQPRCQPVRSVSRHVESGLLAAASSTQISIFAADAEYRYGFGSEQGSTEVVGFAGDGRLVSVNRFGVISVWPAATGGETEELRHRGKVISIDMDPTGRRAVTLCEDNEAMVWEPATGRREATFAAHRVPYRWPGQLVFTPSGRRLVVNGRHRLDVHDLDTGDSTTVDVGVDPAQPWDIQALAALDEDTVFVTADRVPPALVSLNGQSPRPMTGRFAEAREAPVITPDKRYALTKVRVRPGNPLLHNPNGAKVSGWGVAGLQCWDLATGELAWTRHASISELECRAFQWFFVPGNDTVWTTDAPCDAPELLILDLVTGETLDRVPEPPERPLIQPPHRLPDGVLGFFITNPHPRLWRVTVQELVQDPGFAVPLVENESVWVKLVIPGTDLVIARDQDNVWCRYRLSTGEQLSRSDIPRDANVVAVTPDGATIVVGEPTGYVRMVPSMSRPPARALPSLKEFHLNSSEPIRPLITIDLDLDDVQDAVLLPDDDTLVVCTEPDSELHLVSLESGSVRTVSGHDGPVNTLALADEGRLLLSGSEDGTIRVWDTETWDTKLVLEGHEDVVRDVAAAGMVAASGSEDRTVRVWDLADGSCLRVFEGYDASMDMVAVSPDAAMVVSVSADDDLTIWDVKGGTGWNLGGLDQQLGDDDQETLGHNRSRSGHHRGPSAMLFGPDTDTLYTAESELIAWNLFAGTERARSERRDQSLAALARHPESGLLAAASYSQISIFSADAEYLDGFGSEQGLFEAVSFAGDGRVVSVNAFGEVSVWPASVGDKTGGLRHRGKVGAIVMDPTGRRAATVCEDNEVMVWELATGRQEAAFVAEGWSLHRPGQVAFTPDGARLVINTRRGLNIRDLGTGENTTMELDMDSENTWFSEALAVVDTDTVFVTADHVPPMLMSLTGGPPRPMTGPFAEGSRRPVITEDKRYALTTVTIKSGSPLLHNPANVEMSEYDVNGLQCWDLATGELAWTRHDGLSEHGYRGCGWFFITGDGTVFTTENADGDLELLVIDLATGDIRDRLPEPFEDAFHRPPHRLAGGAVGFFSDDEDIQLWTITERGFVKDPQFAIGVADGEPARVELVIPTADLVITRDRNDRWCRYRLSTAEQLSRPDISTDADVLAVTGDGVTIVVGDTTGYVHIVSSGGERL